MSKNIQKIKIKGVDIILEDKAPNQGKVIVSDNNGNNYSMFWGAMGGTLQEFICRVNSSNFACFDIFIFVFKLKFSFLNLCLRLCAKR